MNWLGVIIFIIVILIFISYNKKRDKNEKCEEWAKKNECEINPKYMLKSCAKSCDLIKSGKMFLSDKNEKCEEWANNGECKKNPNYMLKNCATSCSSI